MEIQAGTRLGPYEIVSAVGAGGMGEVWRARDTRLDRDVAVKVLPASFAANAQLRLRFEREAKTISSLNHPHICTLHDVGQHEGVDYLVMELIEGESLADRLRKGPLPLDLLLRCGAQIARALDAAHRRGIVHRDLKPANVMLTPSGAKLLDFGLAKSASESAIVMSEGTGLATEARPLTREGTILGTFQYMAPEQLEGAEADARTDIFAFGALLYEMATGKRAFQGASKTSLIAAIVSAQPEPVSAVTPMSPPALDHVVARCLAKAPDERWQSALDVASELEWIAEAGSRAGVAAPLSARRRSRQRWGWVLAALLLAGAGAAAAVLVERLSVDRNRHPLRTSLVAADGKPYDYAGNSWGMVLSPDGRRAVYVAKNREGNETLMMLPLNSREAQPLAGTDGAAFPFWSPDSRFVAFFAGGKLKKMEANGGPAVVLANVSSPRGGTWGTGDVIVYSPDVQAPLYRVPAAGGAAVPITKLDGERGASSHRWPWFLPDGKTYLYLVTGMTGGLDEVTGIYAGTLDSTSSPKKLIPSVTRAEFSHGRIFWVRDSFLVAQELDAGKLELRGEPVPVAEQVRTRYDVWGITHFSLSQNGLLAYDAGGSGSLKLVSVDRSGAELGTLGQEGPFQRIRLSPDGKRLAASILDPAAGSADIWIFELGRDVKTRITFDPGSDTAPVWSPDGTRIVFSSHRNGVGRLIVKSATGGTSEEILSESPSPKSPEDWSPDGRFIAFNQSGKEKDDLWVLPLSGDRKPFPLVATPADEGWARFSPDGKWLSYLSNESGQYNLYAMRFPRESGGGKWQISSRGAEWGFGWRGDGREVYYMDANGVVYASSIDTTANLEAGPSRPLFTTEMNMTWAVHADGTRFIFGRDASGARKQPTTLIVDWPAAIAR